MPLFILSDEIVTQLGRLAAIILSLYLFLFVVLAFVASLLLLFANTWLRDKVGLLHNVRSLVENIDTALHTASSETLPATIETESRLGQTIQAIHTVQSAQLIQRTRDAQRQVSTIEQKVEPVADRIAEGVIEFRARTVMVQGILKAFFLPGLIKQKPRTPLLLPAAPDFSSAEYTTLPAESSSLPVESSNVVVAQPNLPGGHVQPAGTEQLEPLESEGAERSDDAPGH